MDFMKVGSSDIVRSSVCFVRQIKKKVFFFYLLGTTMSRNVFLITTCFCETSARYKGLPFTQEAVFITLLLFCKVISFHMLENAKLKYIFKIFT
jgi:hypothetical protein